MIPLYLNPASVRIALIGRGSLAVKRLAWLKSGGATPDIWSDTPSQELAAASERIVARLPQGEELAQYHAIWIADLPRDEAERLVRTARGADVLVNVEDVIDLCDFHSPAVVRRGKLVLAAATGGASPAVARAAREHLEGAFPEAWSDALEEVAQSRASLRSDGASLDTLVADARTRLAQRGLI